MNIQVPEDLLDRINTVTTQLDARQILVEGYARGIQARLDLSTCLNQHKPMVKPYLREGTLVCQAL